MKFFSEVVLNYDGAECLVWPFGKTGGYGTLVFDGKQQRVHRLVCEATHGPPPTSSHQAAHSCGNRGCVASPHIRWATQAENEDDKKLHGTWDARISGAKLADDQVREIRALKGSASYKRIAEHFGVTPSAVGLILRGERWKHLR